MSPDGETVQSKRTNPMQHKQGISEEEEGLVKNIGKSAREIVQNGLSCLS